jgi:mRNA-degrading endonuclease RelE of RelBE toxin-antitoxin system
MAWTVTLSRKAEKQARKLPESVRSALFALIKEIRSAGPVRGNWSNYGKLAERRHHCHIKKGKPTYVAVWEERAGEVHLAEVIYVGTHEKAPY